MCLRLCGSGYVRVCAWLSVCVFVGLLCVCECVSVCLFFMILCDSLKVWQTAYMAAPWELLFVMSTILEEGLEPRPSMINVFIPSQHTEAGTRVWDDPQPCDWGSGSVGGWVAERDTRCVQAKGFKPNNPRRVRSKASSHFCNGQSNHIDPKTWEENITCGASLRCTILSPLRVDNNYRLLTNLYMMLFFLCCLCA